MDANQLATCLRRLLTASDRVAEDFINFSLVLRLASRSVEP